MKRIFLLLIALGLGAQTPLTTLFVGPATVVVGPGNCTQSNAYFAQQSGLSGTEITAYDTAICGMVTDGTFSLLDGLYFFANASAANARINVAHPGTNTLVEHGTACTFTVNVGFTGNGSCYEDSGFIPSSAGGNFTQNSGTIGACIQASRTLNVDYAEMGSANASYSYFEPNSSGGTLKYDLNGNTFNNAGSVSEAQGSWIISRTTSSLVTAYQNGSSFLTSSSDTSGALSTNSMFVMAYNAGSAQAISSDQLSYALWGAGLTGTQVTNVYNRLHTMLVALGNGAC